MSAPKAYDEWMVRAKSSLAIAREGRRLPDVAVEDLCYEAQQASEKALKAFCILRGVAVPRTHHIGYLLELLKDSGVEIPDEIGAARRLTEYSVETRYPGDYEPVTEQEYVRAVELASAVVKWADSRASRPKA
jgi:HEPN domain-containing protein